MYNVICLIIHVLFALGLFISFKLVDIRKLNILYALMINYVVAIIFAFIDANIPLMDIPRYYSLNLIFPSLILGVLFALNFVLMMNSTQRVGLGLTAALNKMSVVIPAFAGIICFNQVFGIELKFAGIFIALISFVLILYSRNKNVPLSAYILPFGVFVVSGVIDSSMEFTQKYCISSSCDKELFLLGVFATALLSVFIYSLIDKAGRNKRPEFSYETIFAGAMIGLFNYLTSKMVLINVSSMGGSVVFPIHNASVVLLTALIGHYWFKEKFSVKQWIGIGLAIISVVLIASTIQN